MSITFPEISGITEDAFNTLFEQTANLDKSISVYRQCPSFDTNLGVIGGRSVNQPFTVCADDTWLVRAYNDGGVIYAERSADGVTWSAPATIDVSLTGLRPKLVVNSGYDLYLVDDAGAIIVYHSADGNTWDGGSSFSIVTLPVDGTLEAIGYADGIPLLYAVVRVTGNARHIVAIDATTTYDTGLYWPQAVWGFDVERLTLALDHPDEADSGIRHVIVMAAAQAPLYVTKTVDNLPVKQAQLSGGLVSCLVRPPLDSRPLTVTRWFPVEISENTAAQNRVSCHTLTTSSIHSADDHDTLWVVASGFNGDVNTNDIDYSYASVFYYSTRDGKAWSQCKDAAWTGLGGTLPDLVDDSAIVPYGEQVYLLSCEGVIQSPGCLEFNNPMAAETLDLTHYILAYSTTMAETRQTNLTLDNRDGQLNGTLLGAGITLAMITKIGALGNPSTLFQVSVQEVDSVGAMRERPREEMELSARDRLAWLTDRSQSENALQWDSQVVGVDIFQDIAGMENSGLAHTATVKGTFATALNKLKLKSKYKEGIYFKTEKSIIEDGIAAMTFSVPKPADHGGTSSADSPTYAGVVFRALDKDNLIYCRYNRWTQLFELAIRRSGVDTVWDTWAPSGAFLTAANNTQDVGLRVEYKGARLRIYEASLVYPTGASYIFSKQYICPAHREFAPVWLAGYAGGILCGFSDEDDGTTTEPDPVAITSTALPDGAFLDSGTGHIGALRNNIEIWETTNFSNVSPTWVQHLVAGSTNLSVYSAVMDAFSPGYVDGAGPINMWIAANDTSTDWAAIYYLEDVFGARTLTKQYDIPVRAIYGAALDASFAEPGFVACTAYAGQFSFDKGSFAVHTTNGASWSGWIKLTGYYAVGGGSPQGCCWVSSNVHGEVFATAYTTSDGFHSRLGLYRSTDHGATWAAVGVQPTKPGSWEGGMYLPYASNPADDTVWWSATYFGDDAELGYADGRVRCWLYKRTAGVWTDKSWLPSGNPTGPVWGMRHIAVAPTAANRIAIATYDAIGVDHLAVSDDGGTTWADRGDISAYPHSAITIAGDDPDTMYGWGSGIAYSSDAGVTWYSKNGSMGGTPPNLAIIFGGPTP